jgi:ribosomal protein S18 acetylase RimI-like enzyme
MPPAKILAASDFDLDQLADVFNRGYQGYLVPLKLNTEQIGEMIGQNGIDVGLSKVALVDNYPIGIGFLAKRSRRGWIGGMGVDPAYRRQHIGRLIMDSVLDTAWEEGIETVQLEVINSNHGAQQLYEDLNFRTRRKLLILACDKPSLIETTTEIETIPAGDALMYYHDFHQIPNPWQREFESLHYMAPRLTGWLALRDDTPVAYVVGSTSGVLNLMDFANAPSESDALAGLISYIHRQYPGIPARVVNLVENDPAYPVLVNLGYQQRMSQSEMHLQF